MKQQTKEEFFAEIDKIQANIPHEVYKHLENFMQLDSKQRLGVGQFTKEFLSYNPQAKKLQLVSVILSVIGYALGLAPFFFAAYTCSFLYGYYQQGALSQLSTGLNEYLYYALICLICLIGHLVFCSISTLISHKIAFDTLHNLRMALFEKLKRIPQSYMVNNSPGDIKTIILDRTNALEDWIAHVMPELPGRLLQPVLGLLILIYIDWRVALCLLAPLGLVVLGMGLSMRNQKARMALYMASEQAVNARAQEYVHGIAVIKAFLQLKSQFNLLARMANFYLESTLGWWKQAWMGMAISGAALASPLLILGPFSFYLFSQGQLSINELALSLMLPFLILVNTMPIMMSFELFSMAVPAWISIKELAEQEELKTPTVNGSQTQEQEQDLRLDPSLGIEFKDASLIYTDPQGEQILALDGLNLSIESSQMTAIVGPSGSGKSSIARLITRAFDLSSGELYFQGKKIDEIPFDQLMQEVSYVAQDTFLFDASIADNIRLGNPQASNEEVLKAARLAACHDFIEKLPQGYDTPAGEAGKLLSGGERQRITLARALLKDAPIIILDEASAYTDPESELQIQEALQNLVKDKSLIVIAHRLSTIVSADKIVLLDKGKLEACGTHSELLKHSKLYQNLWSSYEGACA